VDSGIRPRGEFRFLEVARGHLRKTERVGEAAIDRKQKSSVHPVLFPSLLSSGAVFPDVLFNVEGFHYRPSFCASL